MKTLLVADVFAWCDSEMPFSTAEEFDNVGLLVGSLKQPVRNVLVALDVTPFVIKEAVRLDAQLIVSHHPLMFHAISTLNADRYEGYLLSELIKNNLALISCHTNLDKTRYAGAYGAAEKLGLQQVLQLDDYMIVGSYAGGNGEKLVSQTNRVLSAACRVYGQIQKDIQRVAIAGGAYSAGFRLAAAHADAFITAEIKHHEAIEASNSGLLLIDAGHFETERPILDRLALGLQNAFDQLQYKARVFVSTDCPYLGTKLGEEKV